jgi:hypothetical protein
MWREKVASFPEREAHTSDLSVTYAAQTLAECTSVTARYVPPNNAKPIKNLRQSLVKQASRKSKGRERERDSEGERSCAHVCIFLANSSEAVFGASWLSSGAALLLGTRGISFAFTTFGLNSVLNFVVEEKCLSRTG